MRSHLHKQSVSISPLPMARSPVLRRALNRGPEPRHPMTCRESSHPAWIGLLPRFHAEAGSASIGSSLLASRHRQGAHLRPPLEDAAVLLHALSVHYPSGSPRGQWRRSRGGNGSFPGATVSESRHFRSRPWMRTSPPPRLDTIFFARASASRCVGNTALARSAFGRTTAHPSSRFTTNWSAMA